MKQITLGNSGLTVPAVIVGCMRLWDMDRQTLNHFIHAALEQGANYFDHADIYGWGAGPGACEEHFGAAIKNDPSIRREDLIIQSKCGICRGYYDSSKEHILSSVDGILKRLQTDYLDVLLIHRPDALVEPEEVAAAFDELEQSGKVRRFGVSNHRPMQIELLKRYVRQPLAANQLQFSIPVSNMAAGGLEVNMETAGAPDRDGSVLDYSRLNDMTIQAWSPFQGPSQPPNWGRCFIGDERYKELNQELDALAEQYGVTPTTIATAWILRHPAKMQVVAGTAKESRLAEIVKAGDVPLTRQEWYRLYLAAGHSLP